MHRRIIKKIYPIELNSRNNEFLTFENILEIPNIVLLGEPGSGKTYLFEHASKYENGIYITSRSFSTGVDKSHESKIIYIDALDEKRSRSEHPDSIGEIVKNIKQLKPLKLRISCRVADWLGETDLELFKPYFDANGGFCVVVLEALTEAEIDQILVENKVDSPNLFRENAKNKGVSSLLNNPQTLIMLAELVKIGDWANSKKDLYEKATDLLLTEINHNHQHKPLVKKFSKSQLKEAAGAACATLLIADVDDISFNESGKQPFCEIPYSDADCVLAALVRRVFTIEDQKARYSHRTIAEYLAACWLASQIHKGLPLSRVRSLLCIENHPTTELRGLYAWLSHLLPSEQADTLLEFDPYGVLVLGDVGCLSLSSRKVLLKALIKLSEKDPWFRGQDWSSESLGAISTQDMADEFITLLHQYPEIYHLRSLILDAIGYGDLQPKLKDELLNIFCNGQASFGERERAFTALINAVPNGKELVVKVSKELQVNSDGLRLKEQVLAHLFEEYFTVDDVYTFINEYLALNNHHGNIELWFWNLSNNLPLCVLPELLDRISQIEPSQYEKEFQLTSFNEEILKLALYSGEKFEIKRLWLWLSRITLSSNDYLNEGSIKKWLAENQQVVVELLKIALQEKEESVNVWLFWNDFQKVIQYTYNINEIIEAGFTLITEKKVCDSKDQFIFELILSLTICKTTNLKYFSLLIEYGAYHPELAEICKRSLFSEILDWYWQQAERKNSIKKDHLYQIQKNKEGFEQFKDLIRSGENLGWLEYIAKIYFSKFHDLDRKLTSYNRLEEALGKDNLEIALEGLKSILCRNDLPTPLEIAILYGESKSRDWWYTILAGFSESWKINLDLDKYPEAAIKAALAINLVYPTYIEYEGNNLKPVIPDWQKALFKCKPELVQTVYLKVIETVIKTKKQNVPGIREICENTDLANNREIIVLHVLTDHPNAPIEELSILLSTALGIDKIKEQLLMLIQKNVQPRARVRLKQKELWLCAGLMASFENYKETVDCYTGRRDNFIWKLINFLNCFRSNRSFANNIRFSASQYSFLINLVGKRFPDAYLPNGVSWLSNQEPSNAAEFVKNQITQLSTQIDDNSVHILNCLIEEPDLKSYLNFIKHAASNQSALRRQEKFIQPDWHRTISALKNGKPANIADLHALTIEHLRDIAIRIRTENTDIYKMFWNEDSYGKIKNEPKPEESCRDRLIDLLRPKFSPLEIIVEPEGHMVTDKRADIVVKFKTEQTLPIEVKQDYHDKLWAACENQLDKLYVRDPQANGYGIYLVFWFGDQRKRSISMPPTTFKKPNSAHELEEALRSQIKAENQFRLSVVVIDVTRPED